MDDHCATPSSGLPRFVDHYHRCAVLCGGALVTFAWSRIISVASRQHFIQSMLLLVVLSALFLGYQQLRKARRQHWPLALVWIALCLYFAALALWNQIYFEHIAHTGFADDVFRTALRTFQAPVYGVPKALTITGLGGALMFAALFLMALRWAVSHAAATCRVAMVFMTLELLAMVGFAWCAREGQWPDPRLIHGGFNAVLDQFSSPGALWSQWNAQMSQFHGNASHYPPGPAFIALLELRYDLPGLWMICSMLAVVLCIPPVLVLCADLALAPVVSVYAAAWLIASAASLSFTPVANAAPTAFLTLALLAALGRALRGRWWFAALGGLALGCHGLYSFTAVFAALLGLAWLLAATAIGATTRVHALRCAAMLLLGSLGLWLLVYVMTGFNLADCLAKAVTNNRASMSRELFEVPSRYLLRSSGNLLAYGAYLGPLAGLYALLGVWRAPRTGGAITAFACATAATVLLAGFSGSFFLETERIWMFFTPAVAIVAGVGLADARGAERLTANDHLTLVASALLAWILALAMHQQLPPDEHISADAWQRARILLRPASPPRESGVQQAE